MAILQRVLQHDHQPDRQGHQPLGNGQYLPDHQLSEIHAEPAPFRSRHAVQRGHDNLTDALRTEPGTAYHGTGTRGHPEPSTARTEPHGRVAATNRTHCHHGHLFCPIVRFVYAKGNQIAIVSRRCVRKRTHLSFHIFSCSNL